MNQNSSLLNVSAFDDTGFSSVENKKGMIKRKMNKNQSVSTIDTKTLLINKNNESINSQIYINQSYPILNNEISEQDLSETYDHIIQQNSTKQTPNLKKSLYLIKKDRDDELKNELDNTRNLQGNNNIKLENHFINSNKNSLNNTLLKYILSKKNLNKSIDHDMSYSDTKNENMINTLQKDLMKDKSIYKNVEKTNSSFIETLQNQNNNNKLNNSHNIEINNRPKQEDISISIFQTVFKFFFFFKSVYI